MLTLFISPAGHPYLVHESDADLTALEKRLAAAFENSYVHALLALATSELTTPLTSEFDFLRSFAKTYFTKLCHQPEANIGSPSLAEFEFFLATAPVFGGLEYLNSNVLTDWWNELDLYVHKEIAQHPSGAADWIQQQNPLWRTVGRVTFHLAENKQSEERPFAFMATYTDKVSSSAKPVQLPLSKALSEYSSAKDRQGLLRLLQPIDNAAEKCSWVRTMINDQTVYQPRAWTAKQAYQLLQDIPDLEDAGLIVRVPDWWKNKHTARPSVKVNIGAKHSVKLTVDAMLQFDIETVLNGETLTREELAELLNAEGHLVRLRGEWIEIDREKLQETLDHWQEVSKLVRQEGLSFAEGMRILSGLPLDAKWDETGKELAYRDWAEIVPVGEFAEALAAMRDPNRAEDFSFDQIGLQATLRPYQETGVRWLRMLTQLGLGACLADDMGLGKTIQVITLLLIQKHQNKKAAPALLVAPASLLGNWESEIKKFAPTLNIHIAHSSGSGTQLPKNFSSIHLVMTTYGMTERIDWLKQQHWNTVILDEAQAIKNAGTRQAKSIKELRSKQRIAMTGTPIENRLSDLWSLFDFLNPGLLGNKTAFGKFVKLLQEEKNRVNYAPLRKLTSPYILRRLKTDKNIISDLPEKTEVTAWCGLSKQQTVLYSQVVEMLKNELENTEGIKRQGSVLGALMRFKQICNHPAQYTGSGDYAEALSGKFGRLSEICEEIASRQEKVLVFTQFKEITEPLAVHLQSIFRRSGLILDGSTAIKKRKEMVEAFQKESGPPFFVLSLKAGGTGLNLTAAQHVIHFDRWWNPAVENQATDRAFRIGQKKNVLVHKFVCRGTLEEKINELIESKKALADDVMGQSSEQIITEMSNEELLKMVTLDVSKVSS